MPSAPIPAEQLPAGIAAAWSHPPERKVEKKEEREKREDHNLKRSITKAKMDECLGDGYRSIARRKEVLRQGTY
jgi:hypothetical protein